MAELHLRFPNIHFFVVWLPTSPLDPVCSDSPLSDSPGRRRGLRGSSLPGRVPSERGRTERMG